MIKACGFQVEIYIILRVQKTNLKRTDIMDIYSRWYTCRDGDVFENYELLIVDGANRQSKRKHHLRLTTQKFIVFIRD